MNNKILTTSILPIVTNCIIALHIALISNIGLAQEKLHVPGIFGDNMVLQQNSKVQVWGRSAPGEEVTIKSTWGASATTTADGKGSWRTYLLTGKADNKNRQLIITSGNETLKFNDVLLGEVWLASGQSNIDFQLMRAKGGKVAVDNSRKNNVRLFQVPIRDSATPLLDVDARWVTASPSTVPEFSAVAYYFANKLQQRLNVPVGIIQSSWGGSVVEAWMEKDLLDKFDFESIKIIKIPDAPQIVPSAAFNGMIFPILGYSLKGVIWYQGESNSWKPKGEYIHLFPAFIQSLRTYWQSKSMPFYYVQIASYDYGTQAENLRAADIRQVQLDVMNIVPNTGMVVTLDVGNCSDIHPLEKETVSERLANWALANDYGMKNIKHRSPTVDRVSRIGDNLKLHFADADGALKGNFSGIEVAKNADSDFFKAKAMLVDRNSILVSSEDVPRPNIVRYASGPTCPTATIYNQNDLPASPFLIDLLANTSASQ
jgi:sialate O-acetylesterase